MTALDVHTKSSETTRKLVEGAIISRDKLIANLKMRYECEAHVDVDTDVLTRRIALSLKAFADTKLNATARAKTKASDFDSQALLIIGKKHLTKTVVADDQTRTKNEQDMFAAAKQWLNRVKSEAGIKALREDGSEETRGGKRAPRTPETKSETAPIVAPPATSEPATFAVPKIALPKPKATAEISELIAMLGGMAAKLLAENAASDVLKGDEGMAARDALTVIGRAAADYKARILQLEARKPDAPEGAKRAALKAAIETGAAKVAAKVKAPVAEIDGATTH